MINLVTGGAGFLGSHLIDTLLNIPNEKVICVDNFLTGDKKNISKWINNPKFKFIKHDITNPLSLNVQKIWHLACPASPYYYQNNPIETLKTSFLGTYNMLNLAKENKATLLMASTSEVYGDPLEHPQSEGYRGSVNVIGIRSCYDEGKRVAETLCADYQRIYNVNLRIVRIFNTYGPGMRPNDGRVVSNFIVQALQNKPLTIYGNGNQTRSFCYVDDLINGMCMLMKSNFTLPLNIGNPYEVSINKLSDLIIKKINPSLHKVYVSLPEDDPQKRNPSVDLAKQKLKWEPKINLSEGLDKTINYFKKIL